MIDALEITAFLTGTLSMCLGLFIIRKQHKQINAIMEMLEIVGQVKKVKHQSYHFEWTIKGEIIKVKLLYAPMTKEVSFNSKSHWQLFKNGSKAMAETKGFDKETGNKLIIIYPEVGKVVKYINENEVVFVKPFMDVFGMQVITVNEIETYIQGQV